MEHVKRPLAFAGPNDAADYDFTRRNILNINARLCEGLEHTLGNAAVGSHPDTDHADFADLILNFVLRTTQFPKQRIRDRSDFGKVLVVDGKTDIGFFAARVDILDDVVHVDLVLSHEVEDLCRHARQIGDIRK